MLFLYVNKKTHLDFFFTHIPIYGHFCPCFLIKLKVHKYSQSRSVIFYTVLVLFILKSADRQRQNFEIELKKQIYLYLFFSIISSFYNLIFYVNSIVYFLHLRILGRNKRIKGKVFRKCIFREKM